MINKRYLILIIVFLFGIIFLDFGLSYSSSNLYLKNYGISTLETKNSCSETSDFIMQIQPFGCTPQVITSDLLEESDVPVFCQLAITKINPLIDVNSIESVSISGDLSSDVSGVAFYPARSSLNTGTTLTTSVLENIGYVVINVKKHPNSSSMPDSISGNLTATIKYDVNDALGLGDGIFYVPELSEEDWELKKSLYSFWGGKGYLKVESVGSDEATISLYDKEKKISTSTLKKRETSNPIYLSGVECSAGLRLNLLDLTNPDTKVQLKINSEIIEVGEGEKFLDNKCIIKDIEKNGLKQKTTIKCQEDEETSTFDLMISPKLILNINGENKKVEVGNYLYEDKEGNGVYLAYIGTKVDSTKPEDLFVYLVSMPKTSNRNLSAEELSSFNLVVGDLIEAKQDSSGIVDTTSAALKSIAGLSNRLSRMVIKNQKLHRINFGKIENVFDSTVSIINYAGSTDSELDPDYKEEYESAKEVYEQIINQYGSESFSSTSTYGEKALASEINLAYAANQKRTAAELCEKFIHDYPDSLITPYLCEDIYKLSNENSEKQFVKINNKIKEISLNGIYEPSFEEYGVKLNIINPEGKSESYELTKGKQVYVSGSSSDYIQLISIEGNSAKIKISISTGGFMNAVKKEFGSDVMKLEQDITKDIQDYSFTLTKINLKKSAKISLTSTLNNDRTKTNFSFKLGIEQRAINLSTDKINETIQSLDELTQKFEKISNSLDSMVTSLKTICLSTGAVLITKNFIAGIGNEGTARQIVMRGMDGWYEKCSEMINKNEYESMDSCLSQNSDTIDSDVNSLTQLINKQNSQIKILQSSASKSTFLSEEFVDTDAFMKNYIPQVAAKISNSSLGNTITDPSGKGEPIQLSSVLNAITYSGWKNNYFSISDIRNIELYIDILESSSVSENLKVTAKAELYSELFDINVAYSNSKSAFEIANELELDKSDIVSLETEQKVRKLVYTGLINKDLGKKKLSQFSDSTPVAIVQIKFNGEQYITILEPKGNFYYIKNLNNQLQIYSYDSLNLVGEDAKYFLNVYFEKYDSSTFKNKYTNPKLSYYETEPYKGLPAIVSFDTENGWYAATKETLPVAGNIQTYDASGKVNSFYLCNVGSNGAEEFSSSGYGDDECILINTGTGQPDNQIPGLSESEAKKLVSCALSAIEQAAKAYPAAGKVKISTSCGGSVIISVGEPAVDVPAYACQDFMSPEDCLTLFNVCDPVICPSSRCDFGGTYPVSEVTSSGIIGSILLCLPNYKEGIIVPVCLTGIKNGIDSLLSILNSYKQCMQESLDTGKMVGVCDEIYSIYLCEFFWKQALPLANLAVPKIMEAFMGQNVHGGGEYLSVDNALKQTETAVSYFSNYYGASATESFSTRTKEVIKDEICKVFISETTVSTSELLDTLTESDSPPQYYGKFEESQLTTATTPALSHYKVYYHIYSGKNSGAYYQVYLTKTNSISYYQDSSSSLTVASGYINTGGYASETKDFTAVSGYDKLCISVNGQEECGFQSITTDWAINYAQDEYLSEQSKMTGITSQEECISGTVSLYNVLNLNIQSGIESTIDPAIYNKGIIRVCATSSPGKGTDPNYNNENARWIDVGYCDDEKMRCWIDTESVSEVIKSVSIENQTLSTLSDITIESMQTEGDYLTDTEFSSMIKEIEEEPDLTEKINLINSVFEKTFWSYQKANLLLLKGDVYSQLFSQSYAKHKQKLITNSPTVYPAESPEETVSEGTNEIEITSEKSSSAEKILKTAESFNHKIVPTAECINCFESVYYVYEKSGTGIKCVYSGNNGDKYAVDGGTITLSSDGKTVFQVASDPSKSCSYNSQARTSISESNKLKQLKPGYLISYAWNSTAPHNAIFIEWENEAEHIARLFDWNGNKIKISEKTESGEICSNSNICSGRDYCKTYRYYNANLSDNAHPVYMIWKPVSNTNEEVEESEESQIPSNSEEQSLLYAKAFSLLNEKISSISLIKISLNEIGISISANDIKSLIKELDSNKNFVKINAGEIKKGDIVLIGKNCVLPYSIGIVGESASNKYYFYTSYDNKVKEDKTSSLFSVSSGIYIYKAYRYKSGSSGREEWNLDNAIDSLSTLSGDYKDNKGIIDQFLFDGLFTEKECSSIRPTNILGIEVGNGETILNIKNMLLVKKA